MAYTLRDHMRQRWLDILDLIHDHTLDLTDRMCIHFSKRCLQKSASHFKTQSLQHIKRHIM